jgi:hypothetical protein
MTKVLAVEHLRTMILTVFGMIPIIGLALWLMLMITVGDAEPSFRILIGVLVAVAVLLTGGIALYLMLIMHKPRRYFDDMAKLATGPTTSSSGAPPTRSRRAGSGAATSAPMA